MSDILAEPLPPWVIDAIYKPAVLRHQRGNPLIEALPPHHDIEKLSETFGRLPSFSETDRGLPTVARIQLVSLLDNYLEPLPKHFSVYEKLGLVLRAGYNHRNPLNGDFRKLLNEFYANAMDGFAEPISRPIPATAPAFSLFGVSGLGKSTTVEEVLSFFPQVLRHKQHGFIQIVWLKHDCPVHGNLKDLLLEILGAIDELIGTQYAPEKRNERSIPQLIADVAKIAARHYLGLLVIDEVQNLIDAPGISRADLLKFFVAMGNMAKIPFAFIGTPRARKLFQTLFHSARRAANFGSINWRPSPRDGFYDHFVQSLFSYQWTKAETEWTDEISQCLHELTYGVEALDVRLYQLTQIATIRSGGDEIMTPEKFREVAASEFGLLEPMLEALRTGKINSRHVFEDLFVRGLEDLGLKVTNEIALAVLRDKAHPVSNKNSARTNALKSLLALGLDPVDAQERVQHVFRCNPDVTAEEAVQRVLSSGSISSSAGEPDQIARLQEIVATGESGASAADSLRRAGLIYKPVDQDGKK